MSSPTGPQLRDAMRRPVAGPPPELAQRIKDAIPDDLGEETGSHSAGASRSWHPGRWAAAASIVVALGASLLSWRMLQSGIGPETVVFDRSKLDEVAQQANVIAPQTATPATPQALESSAPLAEARPAVLEPSKQNGETDADSPSPAPLRKVAAQEVLESFREDPRLIRSEREAIRAQNAQIGDELERQKRELEKKMQALPGRRRGAESAPADEPKAAFLGAESARDDRSNRVAKSEETRVATVDARLRDTAPSIPDVVSSDPLSVGRGRAPNDQLARDMFFESAGVHPFIDTEDDPLSTFGLDVDTGSYTLARRYLERGALPPRAAIRVEEFLNYFDYDDPAPRGEDLAIRIEGGPSPFNENSSYRLVRIAVTAKEIAASDRRLANLVFLIDVSGSMARQGRLQQVKLALSRLAGELTDSDRIGIVTYSEEARLVLDSTSDRQAVESVVGDLRPGGSTNLAAGLDLAYRLAARHWMTDGINRIILCSDGVANVGATSAGSILASVDAAVRQGIEITTIGFGLGNYNDALMEQLADRGNGSYYYVDSPAEAQRVVVENLTGTLETVATDARIQVEFDPRLVSRYRLLGYENRAIADDRFRDDTIDAGEIGAGHRVTALYEIKLRETARRGRLADVRLRWLGADGLDAREESRTLRHRDLFHRWEDASESLRLAAVVSELAEVLRGSYWARDTSLTELAGEARKLARTGSPKQQELARLAEIVERLHASN